MPENDQARRLNQTGLKGDQVQIEYQEQNEFICIFKKNYKIAYASPSLCNYFKRKPEKLIGKNFLDSIFKNERPAIDHQLARLTPQNPVLTFECHLKNSENQQAWQKWTFWAVFGNSGRFKEFRAIGRDITDLKKAEDALRSSEEALRKKNEELERKNTALIEVLEQIEHQKNQIKNDVITNIDELLFPILEQMGIRDAKSNREDIDLLKRSLNNLATSFGRKITHKSLGLSPREIQISNMVKQGLTSKEISNVLNISVHTVGRHRHSIRKKINITHRERNLNTYLQSL